MDVKDILLLAGRGVGGLFWLLTYVVIIRRGFRDRTCGMPFVPLCINLSWEFTFSFLYPHGGIQLPINVLWFLFDVVILYQFLRFGPAEHREGLLGRSFPATTGLVLALSFLGVLAVTLEFENWNGMYTSFGSNLLMSVLFVRMLIRRRNTAGQSIYVALFKMLGTLTFAFLFFDLYPASYLLNYLYPAILIFDVLYFVLLRRTFLEEGIDPWTRKPLRSGRTGSAGAADSSSPAKE